MGFDRGRSAVAPDRRRHRVGGGSSSRPYIPLDSARLADRAQVAARPSSRGGRPLLPAPGRRSGCARHRDARDRVDHQGRRPATPTLRSRRPISPTSPTSSGASTGGRRPRSGSTSSRDDSLAISGVGRPALQDRGSWRQGRQALRPARHGAAGLGQPVALAVLGHLRARHRSLPRRRRGRTPATASGRIPMPTATGSAPVTPPAPRRFARSLPGEWHLTNSPVTFDLLARASGLDVVRFHGFGNETDASGSGGVLQSQSDRLPARAVDHVSAGPPSRSVRRAAAALLQDRFRSEPIHHPHPAVRLGRFRARCRWEPICSFDTRNRSNAATHGVLVTGGGELLRPRCWIS